MKKNEITRGIGKRRWLIIPLEIKSRELTGKLLLGACAVDKGFAVIIGHKEIIRRNLHLLPCGVVLEKDFRLPICSVARRARAAGHRIMALDEEGLVTFKDWYLKNHVSRQTLAVLDKVFTWGPMQTSWITEAFPSAPISEVGNPRLDLMRSEYCEMFKDAITDLHSEFGKYILINSNFGWCNNAMHGFEEYFIKSLKLETKNQLKFFSGGIKYQRSIMKSFEQLIPALAKAVTPQKIVIRPHPSELSSNWDEFAKIHSNVVVRRNGPVQPWIAGASCIIQNNCTTAVEAAILGKTCISYRPVRDANYDFDIVSCVSENLESMEEVIERVQLYQSSGRMRKISNAGGLERYLAVSGEASACELLVDELEQCTLRPSLPSAQNLRALRWEGYKGKFIDTICRLGKELPGWSNSSAANYEYSRQKFPGLNAEEIDGILQKIRKIKRFDSMYSIPLARNVVCIFNR